MNAKARMPVAYVPHGGGPVSYVDIGFPKSEVDALAAYWRSLGALAPERPRALLVISAHWETRVPTVLSSPDPGLLYDYYGFPPASYQIRWPTPGAPALAGRVRGLLARAGIESAEDPDRGFDHGTFIPFGRSFPGADIPTSQLSLTADLDPAGHLAVGRALAPLRDEGVLILGSGMSYHNMRAFTNPSDDAERFDRWLRGAVALPPGERDRQLERWDAAPAARRAHPREEHLLPLMVVAGAAGSDVGAVPFRGTLFGKPFSAVHFG